METGFEDGFLGTTVGDGVATDAWFALDNFKGNLGWELDTEDFILVGEDGDNSVGGEIWDFVLKTAFWKLDLLVGFWIHEAEGFASIIEILHLGLVDSGFFDLVTRFC